MMATFLLEQPKIVPCVLSFMIFKIAESWIFFIESKPYCMDSCSLVHIQMTLMSCFFFCDSFINDSYGFVLVNQSEESNPLLIFLN